MTISPQRQPDALASARHELPTHLQVEDRLIAGLTVRQTLLLSAGLSVSYSLWRHLAGLQLSIQTALAPAHMTGLIALVALAVRLALAALPAGAFALVALARPADRPLEEWGVITLRYLTLPKTLIWRSAGFTWRDASPTPALRLASTQRELTRQTSGIDGPDDDDDDDEEPDDDVPEDGGLLPRVRGRGGLLR